MNYLGHPFVAYKVTNNLDEYLIAGSYIPDFVPFVPNSVFAFEEIHEGGEKLLNYLDKTRPEKRNLALGVMAHGVTYGADKFSRYVENKYESFRPELIEKILECTPNLKPGAEVAGRFHNFLWWGVDVCILREEESFMKNFGNLLSKIDIKEISNILAGCYRKDKKEVERMTNFMFEEINKENSGSVEGLVKIWAHIASGLPEKDEVNIEKTVEVFDYCASIVKDDWKDIVSMVVNQVKANMHEFIN